MTEPMPNTQFVPYRRTATDQFDPSRTDHENGSANGSTHASASLPHDATFLLPPPPPVPVTILPDGKHALSGVALRAFSLGIVLGACTIIAASTLLIYQSGLWRLPFFFAILSIFHFLEFFITAQYNTPGASLDAFLLTSNGSAYNVAHMLAALETTLFHSFLSYPTILPHHWQVGLMTLGFSLVAVGQLSRSMAMAQAGTNFNHTVQYEKRRGHELVSTGIYAILRHPSYFGFFWWGIGSQIVLGNVICFAAYLIVLWRFFNRRIRGEEKLLVKFFGDSYVEYRKRTYTGIPFIP